MECANTLENNTLVVEIVVEKDGEGERKVCSRHAMEIFLQFSSTCRRMQEIPVCHWYRCSNLFFLQLFLNDFVEVIKVFVDYFFQKKEGERERRKEEKEKAYIIVDLMY